MPKAAETFDDILRGYCRDVVAGDVVACKWTRLACQRQLDDLERAETDPDWPYRWDTWHVDDVCRFLELLPHVEGEWGSSTVVLEPWQVFIEGTVFGWRRKSDGHRRFNTVYEEVARKNAKSWKGSGNAVYCLTCEGEVGPQIKTAATTGQQARILFDVSKAMVDATPALREAFGVETYANSIVCRENSGSIKPINSKASTQDGLNPHASFLDELHAHKDRKLFDVLKSARGARKNPLSWYVTTAGYDIEGVCYEQRRLVEQILEGVIEADHYFGVIYTLDEGDDEFDEAVWPKANPNLGVSVNIDEMRGYAAEARVSPDTQTEFKTKRLNVWCSARGGCINMDRWKRLCEGEVDLGMLADHPCYGGLDLAATTDINALVLVWDIEEVLYTWCRFFVPEATVKPRTERGNVSYQRWVNSGHLTVTPGDVTDYAFIERDVRLAFERFDLRELAFDPWNAYDLVNRLTADELPMVEFRQGIPSFNAPMKELDRRVTDGRLRTGGNPVLRWMASNLVAREDVNENRGPDRKASTEKIDGMVAMLMGMGRAIVAEDDQGVSFGSDYQVATA